ncbi:MAG: hypothetical protein AMXMBFR48_27450 [Ignavibacteriales bacterium]
MNRNNRYDSLFRYYGELNGVDWLLLKAQVRAESGFNPDALSIAGASGLSQFMSNTWKEWGDGKPGVIPFPPDGLYDPRDPEDAIRAQAAYMAWLKRQFGGDIRLTLAAYNCGIGRVMKLAEDKTFRSMQLKLPKETKEYIARVSAFYEEYILEQTKRRETVYAP